MKEEWQAKITVQKWWWATSKVQKPAWEGCAGSLMTERSRSTL